jgi:hypothetical protein
MKSPNEEQVGGSHYLKKIQPWDFIYSNDIGFLEGNIIKYICRYKSKGGLVDLYKAQHYLDKLIHEEVLLQTPALRGK